jgi:hypothetical protein
MIFTMTGLTLTNRSGNTVSVSTTPVSAEVIHLNGAVEPILIANVPQDTYVAANVTLSFAEFFCMSLNANQLGVGEWPNFQSPTTTVTLPQPITIARAQSSLVLTLQASQSVTTATCGPTGVLNGPYSITPVFSLTAATSSAESSSGAIGKARNLVGNVTSIDAAAGSFQLTALDGPAWTVTTSASTAYQGIGGSSALASGMPVDVDASIQADGSLLVTRVSVPDVSTSNLTSWLGPLMGVFGPNVQFLMGPLAARGTLLSEFSPGWGGLGFGSAAFQVSGQFTNLQSLPFPTSFTGNTIVAGQRVLVTTHASTFPYSPGLVPVATMTLMPQTIDGTVTAVSSVGGFAVYSVQLAAYDPFPLLSGLLNQSNLLSNPGTVVVYADASAQALTSQSITIGSVLRFRGLVFNDSGTLRMDCAQILDGASL